MQDGGFNPDKIHDKLDEILKTASALDRKQYSHFYSFEEACAYFDRERELIFRRAIGICSFYDVDFQVLNYCLLIMLNKSMIHILIWLSL
jgi:hypothetical protein